MAGSVERHFIRCAVCCAGCIFFAGTAFLLPIARAESPQLKYLFPAGAQLGATVELEAKGKFDQWPVQVWNDRPGVSLTAKDEKGKLTATVAGDAIPGVHWLRFYDDEGATSLVPFLVGTLCEVNEQEPNNAPNKPQELGNANVIVNGRLQAKGDVDTFAVRLEEGQTLVAEVEAHRTLGSPVDAVLEVVSAEGFVLARNDDDQDMDPRVVFVVPKSGVYLVRTFGFPAVPNSTIGLAGDDGYLYRLTITVSGFLDYVMPLAISAATQNVAAHGWNLTAETQQLTPHLLLEMKQAVLFQPRLANSLFLPVVSHPSIVADEPGKPDQPQLMELPITITGRIEQPRDKDAFRFSAKGGETIKLRVESRLLGYPLDPVLEVRDSQGKQLSRVDDVGNSRDAELAFTAPADGEYQVVVSDLHRQGGANFIYRLTAGVARPDYTLSVNGDAFSVVAGQKLELPITVERLQAFKEPVNVRVEGLPGGVTAEPVISPGEGDAAKSVKLAIAAGEQPFSGPIRILGSTTDTALENHPATAPLAGRTQRTSDLWLTITAMEKK